jgi:uncharacterized protein
LTLYLDTSAVVSLLATEPASAQLDAWLRVQEAEGLAISAWVDTEVSSALSLKIRAGELTIDQRAEILAEWRRWRAGLRLLPVEADAFASATDFAARHELGLRAGDALHLAVAASAGCTLVTLDERLGKAAPQVGVPVVIPSR